ncbi:type II secretion system F family protein [Patescibacteria group bacterium]|nr:type II secretion system F family protein [Patescibacteria group bacterium]MBU1951359.1 type II secretion system F family protein [Patescibacteria group bacterium]
MAVYDYKAKDVEGNSVTGAVEASSETVAVDMLKDKDLIVLSLSERRKRTLFQASLGFLNRVPRKEVVIFSRQLAVMISATVPIVKALTILTKQTENITFKIIVSEIADEVDGGARLSDTLGRYPQVFDDFFVYMIKSGETTGKLDETLNYLADQKEKDYDLTSKIKGAMIYPVFILGALVVVGIVMMIFVIPQLTAVLEEAGTELPWATRMLMATSDFLQNYWWSLIVIAIVSTLSYRLYYRTSTGKKQIDKIKLRIPVFGNIYKKIYLTRFARSFSNLIASGIPLSRALGIVADVIGNHTYKEITLETIKEVEDGNSVSTVFLKHKEVPVMLSQMLTVGEQTGRLDKILAKLADFYAKEVENLVANLVSLIEPMIIALLGVAVAVLVVSILLPLYSLSTAI